MGEEIDFEEDAADYRIQEDNLAAYAMATIDFNSFCREASAKPWQSG